MYRRRQPLCKNRFSGGFCPSRWNNTTHLWLLLLYPVLFYSGTRPGWTVGIGPISALYGSNDVFPRKQVPFGVTTIDDVIWGNMLPKSPKSGCE